MPRELAFLSRSHLFPKVLHTCTSAAGLNLFTAPVNSSKAVSALSSRLSTISTTARQLFSMPSISLSEGRGRTVSEVAVALPRRLVARPIRRAFCRSKEAVREGSRERWKGRSSLARADALRVVATRAAEMEDCNVAKSPSMVSTPSSMMGLSSVSLHCGG
jgi:hypothetical protein